MVLAAPPSIGTTTLESFTLMAGLAAVTTRIKLFATCAVLTLPPPIAARMAVTIDSISHGRFGINIVSGWQRAGITRRWDCGRAASTIAGATNIAPNTSPS